MKEYPEFTQALAPVTANQAGGEIVLNAEDAVLVQQIHAVFQQIGIYDLIAKPGITEIVINEPDVIYFEENAEWKRQEQRGNKSNDRIEALGALLINHTGQSQKFDTNQPRLSLTMPGGERAQLVRKPAAEEASLTIRIPSSKRYTLDEYQANGLFAEILPISDDIPALDRDLQELLKAKQYRAFIEKAILYRKNIVISGATGSGKTTFMKSLLDLISHQERIITIEDAREIFIDHPNKVHLVYPKNAMTESTVTAKSCLEACLRMKPDRIILAECRGDEAFYFVRACGNGHSGSITSCHADSALMAYEQLALMINAAPEGAGLSYDVIRRLIMMTIDVSMHFMAHGGRRYITGIDFDPGRKLQMLRGM